MRKLCLGSLARLSEGESILNNLKQYMNWCMDMVKIRRVYKDRKIRKGITNSFAVH